MHLTMLTTLCTGAKVEGGRLLLDSKNGGFLPHARRMIWTA